jgi:hypothetical protein
MQFGANHQVNLKHLKQVSCAGERGERERVGGEEEGGGRGGSFIRSNFPASKDGLLIHISRGQAWCKLQGRYYNQHVTD